MELTVGQKVHVSIPNESFECNGKVIGVVSADNDLVDEQFRDSYVFRFYRDDDFVDDDPEDESFGGFVNQMIDDLDDGCAIIRRKDIEDGTVHISELSGSIHYFKLSDAHGGT